MDSRLLTLGGLGISATTAIAGPGAAIGTGGVTVAPWDPGHKSALFVGVYENSKNLYQTFSLKCVNRIFSSLDNPALTKAEPWGEAKASDFKMDGLATESETNLEGCLKMDLRHYKDKAEEKGNVFSTIEMAVSRGNHGFILLNSITNMLKEGGYGFKYRAIALKKESNKWRIKGGLQWHDTLFMAEADTPKEIKWTLPDGATESEIFWKSRICTLSEDCEKQLAAKTKVEKNYGFKWHNDDKETKNIYQGLKVESLSSSRQDTDFWSGEAFPLASNSSIVTMASPIFVNDQWKNLPKSGDSSGCCRDSNYQPHPTFKAWLGFFKDKKGKWQSDSSL